MPSMQKLIEVLSDPEYGAIIAASYAFALLVLGGVAWVSLRALKKQQKILAGMGDEK